jgi:hypothetical protein
MRYWEIIGDNLSKAGWSWGCVSAMNSAGRTIWVADAHRGEQDPVPVCGGIGASGWSGWLGGPILHLIL